MKEYDINLRTSHAHGPPSAYGLSTKWSETVSFATFDVDDGCRIARDVSTKTELERVKSTRQSSLQHEPRMT